MAGSGKSQFSKVINTGDHTNSQITIQSTNRIPQIKLLKTAMKQFNQPIFLFHLFLIILIAQFPFLHCCYDNEKNALLNFKSNLIDDPYDRLSSWQIGKNCCDNWRGIQCSNHSSHVVSVDLGNEYLIGAISPSLFNLSHLQYLDLSSNNFNSSKIPYQFANLKHLTYLDLSHSEFSGSITTQFANLSSLRYLDLSYNNFNSSKIPYQFANLKHLTYLDLSHSQFSGSITTQFANLSSLRYLDVSCSDYSVSSRDTSWLRGLANLKELWLAGVDLNSPNPIQLANLTSLSILHLRDCQLQAGSLPYLPPQLEKFYVRDNPNLDINLKSLISNALLLNSLFASNCSIQGSLSTSITNHSQLEVLDLRDNNITGQIPSLMSNLKNLEDLTVLRNNLQGSIPESICEMSSLQYLELGSNKLTETIPNCIWKLENLKLLDVRENSIEGNVSLISLINSPNLIHIYLSSNRLTVEINHQLNPPLPSYKLQQLKYLLLDSCNIKGHIPRYFCNLTNLQFLSLNNNKITGTIPSCFSKLTNLGDLDLSSNNLEGTIPHSFSNMTSISLLDLSSNNLRGHLPIPPQPCYVFDLSKNKFTGGISTEVGEKLSNCLYVSLSANKLSGIIPSFVCPNQAGLKHLDLSNNELRGTIPSSIQYCLSLISLNLGYNNLSGNIPTFIGSLHNLKILYLRSNKFKGLIPKEITHLHQLQILDLSTNNLSGPIPLEIGYLEMLTSRPNNRSLISGKSTIFKNSGLQLQMVTKGTIQHIERLYNDQFGIDLSCNNIEGNIPEEMCLLKELPMLNLSHNCLSGKIPTGVGNMTRLESLDLSFNKLSGHIPESLELTHSLGSLNLSYNNLSGRIPKGPHLETLSGDNGSTYFGNYWLCGLPTNHSCVVEPSLQDDEHDEEDEDEDASAKWLIFAISFLGFVVGFWGLFLVLLLKKKKLWFVYWRAVDSVAIRIIDCIR